MHHALLIASRLSPLASRLFGSLVLATLIAGCGGSLGGKCASPRPLPALPPPEPAAKPAPSSAPTPNTSVHTDVSWLTPVTSVEGVTEHRLANGLRVLLVPDASKPTVTVVVTYLAGSRHEGYGETGMAHLLEHMLFKGTPRRPKLLALLQTHGASFNATTSFDRTNYFETLPASDENLAFAIALEADRMVNARLDGKDLESEFSVVRNELEIGENDVAGMLEERIERAAYLWHGYGRSVIGARSDVEGVPIDRLRDFYRRYYQPDDAVVTIAGRFEPTRALALVAEHLAPLPRPARTLAQTHTVEPAQDGERSVILRRAGDVAMVGLCYHAVAGADVAFPAAEALADALARQPTGRLYRALVERGWATEVSAEIEPLTEPGTLRVFAKIAPGKPVEQVRERLVHEVEAAGAAITERDVERFRNRRGREHALVQARSEALALELSEWAAAGDWRLFFVHRDRVGALRAKDVRAFAAAHLKAENRTIGTFVPTPRPDRAPLPGPVEVDRAVRTYAGRAEPAVGEASAASYEAIDAQARRFALGSGLEVAVLPRRTRGHLVTLALRLRLGDEASLRGRQAALSILAEAVLRGTREHPHAAVVDALDQLHAEVEIAPPSLELEQPEITVRTVREHLPGVLALLGELLRTPALDRKEVEVLRREALARLAEHRADPHTRGLLAIYRALFPWPSGDVRGVPTLEESAAALGALRARDLQGLYRELAGGAGATLAIVGDVDAAKVRGLVERHLGAFRAARAPVRVPRPFREGRVVDESIVLGDRESAFLALGQMLPVGEDHPDWAALVLWNHVLGGAATARLSERLREREGFSYGVGSRLDADATAARAMFLVSGQAAPQNLERAVTAVREEIRRLLDAPVPEAELAAAKASYAHERTLELAEDAGVAALLTESMDRRRPLARWAELDRRVATLGAAEVQAASRRWITPEKMAIVRAGDLARGASSAGPSARKGAGR